MQNTTGSTIGNGMTGLGDDIKDTAQNVADTVNEQFDRGVSAARELSDRASETFGKATSYLRERDISEMSDDLAAYVKSHPLQALAGAAVLGFLAGRLLSRD